MTKKMTQADASRITAATAKQTGGNVPKGSFASRAQATASGKEAGWPSKNEDMPSGGGRQNNPPAPRR